MYSEIMHQAHANGYDEFCDGRAAAREWDGSEATKPENPFDVGSKPHKWWQDGFDSLISERQHA